MAAITISFSDSILAMIFNAQGIANLCDNTATSPLTSLYVSLHTASPGTSGTQSTSEAAYTSYSRVAIVRTSSGWVVSNENCNPVSTISFPTATGGSETETFFGVGSASSGTGVLYFFGAISPSIVVGTGVTPQLGIATVVSMS